MPSRAPPATRTRWKRTSRDIVAGRRDRADAVGTEDALHHNAVLDAIYESKVHPIRAMIDRARKARARWEEVGQICVALLGSVTLVACGRYGYDDRPIELGSGDAADIEPGDGSVGDGSPGSDAMIPVSGLVAGWDLDDGNGQIARAIAGADGVLGTSGSAESRDPSWDMTPGRVCGSAGLSFDGADDVVSIPGSSAPNLSSFTIAFSMRVTGSGGAGLPRIFTKEDGGVADTIIHFRASDDAVAINMFNTGNTLFATFGAGVVRDQRANWVVTFDDGGDRRVHVYRNGTEVSYLRQDVMSGSLRMTTQSWQIGNQSAGIRGFDGTLDAIYVYDRVLAANEIAAVSALCPP